MAQKPRKQVRIKDDGSNLYIFTEGECSMVMTSHYLHDCHILVNPNSLVILKMRSDGKKARVRSFKVLTGPDIKQLFVHIRNN